MILTLGNGHSFDTETDLTAPERHVLQEAFSLEIHGHERGRIPQKEK